MKNRYIFFLVFLLLSCSLNCSAQYRKNAIVFEFLGKGYPGSLCYERNFSVKFNAGAGIGIPTEISSARFFDGYYSKRMNITGPVYLGYSFGNRKSQISTELGVTFLVKYRNQHLLSGEYKGIELLDIMPFISAGYKYKGERYFFDIPLYLMRVYHEVYDGPNFYAPMPMIGFRIGRRF